MKVTAGGVALLMSVIATQASSDQLQPGTVRIVLRLERASHAEARLTIENAAGARASVQGTTFAVVTTGEGERERSYWARVELSSVPRLSAPLDLYPRGKVVTAIKLAELQWAEDRSGTSPEHLLGRAVPPGSYRLQLQVQDPQGGWWRSNELQASIGPSGTVRYR